ncbi:hypothetical protein MKY91_19240 [Alkalicoccobacillus gibsonii]|uniref:Uncharacterized protein n=1 Tax=Alkalicoccobacillus gibsonii TaxID=79881 RepID=A0ABU9VNW7_9BACI
MKKALNITVASALSLSLIVTPGLGNTVSANGVSDSEVSVPQNQSIDFTNETYNISPELEEEYGFTTEILSRDTSHISYKFTYENGDVETLNFNVDDNNLLSAHVVDKDGDDMSVSINDLDGSSEEFQISSTEDTSDRDWNTVSSRESSTAVDAASIQGYVGVIGAILPPAGVTFAVLQAIAGVYHAANATTIYYRVETQRADTIFRRYNTAFYENSDYTGFIEIVYGNESRVGISSEPVQK